jgi:UDP-N-acetylglucosamine acyltransferase
LSDIHPLAVVDSAARVGHGVRIGPFCVIGPDVTIGDGCVLHNNVTVIGHTIIGRNCEFFPGCILGARPQDLKYKGEDTTLEIGDHNVFREQITAHPGTAGGGGVTRIGDHNLLMVGIHIGHDVIIGSHCILANLCLLAGHVVLEDYVTVGGHVGVHHFTTIGKYAMVGGMTKIASDVPPYLTVAGTRSSRQEVRMVNGVGLKRRGFTEEQIRVLKSAFMRLYSRRARTGGVPITRTIHELKAESKNEHVQYLCDFLLRSMECGRQGRYLESLR